MFRSRAQTRNLAARVATGDYLAFLDQDDRWYPQHLELLVAPLEANAAAGWSYCDFDEMDLGGSLVTRSFMRTLGLSHPKQSILECVVGVVHRAEHPVAVRVKLAAVGLHQPPIGGFIVRARGGEQLFLLGCGAPGRGAHDPNSLEGFPPRLSQVTDGHR